MVKINNWYGFKEVVDNINNMDNLEFNDPVIKQIATLYGDKLPELYRKYGEEVFKTAYEDGVFEDANGENNLEKLLLRDFYNAIKTAREKEKFLFTNIDTLKNVIVNGKNLFNEEEFFEKEIVNLFSKDYSNELLQAIFANGKFEINIVNNNFFDILQNLEFEDYSNFVVGKLSKNTIAKWFEKATETGNTVQTDKIIQLLRKNGEFYSELCDKYLEDSKKEEKQSDKQQMLLDYLKNYTINDSVPKINDFNYEKYSFLSTDVILKICDKDSNIYKLIGLYKENLPKLVQKYGYDLLKKVYSENKIEISENLEGDAENKFVKDVVTVMDKQDKFLSLTYDEFKNICINAEENLIKPQIINLFNKYPDELLQSFYNKYNTKFELGYQVKNYVDIFTNIEYEDYSPFLTDERRDLLFIGDLLEKNKDLDIDKVMPILNSQSLFYQDLYNKVVNENPKLSENELKEKIVQEFLQWKKVNGKGLPKVYSIEDISKYDFVRPEVLTSIGLSKTTGDSRKIMEFYGASTVDLVRKYGPEIFSYTYNIGFVPKFENTLDKTKLTKNFDFEKNLLDDFQKMQAHRFFDTKITYEVYKKIITNAPNGYVENSLKEIFEKYSDKNLEMIYNSGSVNFEISRKTKNIVDIFQNFEYKDIKNYISGWWAKDDAEMVLKSVFTEEQMRKIREVQKKSKILNSNNSFILLQDKENLDKMLESAEKIGNIDILNFVIDSGIKDIYKVYDNLHKKYGNYLHNVDIHDLVKETKEFDFNKLEAIIENGLVEGIKNRSILHYGEDLPKEFMEKHSYLFLSKDTKEEIKSKFYNRELKASDILLDGKFEGEMWDTLKNEYLYLGMKENLAFLDKQYTSDANIDQLNMKAVEVSKRIETLEENEMSNETKNIFINWISNNISNTNIEFEDFSKKLRNVYVLISHIILSNSSELRVFQDKIIEELLATENPMHILKNIENGFLEKEKSIDERLYLCFSYLHPNLLEFAEKATSPIIKKFVKEGKVEDINNLLQKDLLKSILGSNNREMRKRLESEEISESLMKSLKELGINSKNEAIEHMNLSVEEANKRNKLVSDAQKIKIEQGDFLKGLTHNGIIYMEQILQNGSLCKEFLGAAASTDCTPLDTDVSIIGESGLKKTYSYGSWGPIYLLLKNDNRFSCYSEFKSNPQDIPDEEILNDNKMEFCKNSSDIGGIRTGFSSTDINAFLIEDGKYDKRLELEIAKNGFYIPIVDPDGKVLFNYKQYEELKSKMNGLSYFGANTEFEFGKNLINDDILELEKQLDEVQKENELIKKSILGAFLRTAKRYNKQIGDDKTKHEISVKDFISDKIHEDEIEVLSTGSSERNTNVPGGKLDFDYIIRFDNKFFKSKKNIQERENIIHLLCDELNIDYRSRNIKDVEIDVDDYKAKVDLSFLGKTNKVEYSTEMCLADRLESLKKADPDKNRFVLANIMLAKKVLGENDAYKKRDGGLGGVGVENWILQNGGSFYEASNNFLKIAKNCGGDYEKFKKQFAIWDFGKNHYSYEGEKNQYPHDDFVFSNLKADKFKKMVEVLDEYNKTHKFEEFSDKYRKNDTSLNFKKVQELARAEGVSRAIGEGTPKAIVEQLSKEIDLEHEILL